MYFQQVKGRLFAIKKSYRGLYKSTELLRIRKDVAAALKRLYFNF